MLATKVGKRVYLLDTMALGQTGIVGAYAIKGPKATIVDCGYATSYETVLSGLREIGIAPSDVRYIIPTHVHLDHAGATGHLLREMPNAKVIAQERGVKHLVDPSRLIESATSVFGKEVMELYGAPLPVPEGRIESVGEEMTVDLGGQLTANLVHSPGHAPHQLSVVIEKEKLMITADAVGIVYPSLDILIPTTPPPSFDPATLIATVSSLEQVTPRRLLVPHFGARGDVGRVFEDTKVKVRQWVEDVRRQKTGGIGLDMISATMAEKVRMEAGVGELPLYALVSVRTSVMGIMQYLDKNP